jgi:hypothetical protein
MTLITEPVKGSVWVVRDALTTIVGSWVSSAKLQVDRKRERQVATSRDIAKYFIEPPWDGHLQQAGSYKGVAEKSRYIEI